MKCHLGEIACAIDRLTQAVQQPTGHDAFDWWTRVVIPIALGLISAGVAVASLRLGFVANSLANTVQRDAVAAREREDRADASRQMIELVDRGLALVLEGKEPTTDLAFNNLHSAVMSRAVASASSSAPRLVLHVMRLFSEDERNASSPLAIPAAIMASTRSRVAIEAWVQTGELDLQASQVVRGEEFVTYAHPLPEDDLPPS